MPSCPKWLPKAARDHWRKLAPQFFRMGVLTRVDGPAFASFCDCFARYVEAVEFLNKHGSVIVVRDDKGTFKFTQAAPQVGIAKKMLEEMRALGAAFGWSPADRARLDVSKKKERPLDEIAKERAAANRREWEQQKKPS